MNILHQVLLLGALLVLTSAPARSAQPGQNEGKQSNAALHKRIRGLAQQLSQIQSQLEENELEKLRQAAQTEAAAAADQSESLKERTYITASRSLQMLNPEISISGDFLATLIFDEQLENFYSAVDDRSGLQIRALDLHIQSSLDPFSLTKVALGFIPGEGARLEELYITWSSVLPNLSMTIGTFRQRFGVVNRWHQHDLEQTDYPLVVYEILGNGVTPGLSQTGLSFSWTMPPVWADANELLVQITNGSNADLFAGDFFSIPSFLARLKSYYDLSENTYFELGLTGLFGMNNKRGALDPQSQTQLIDEPWRPTFVAGCDLTLHWQPLKQARYKSFTWRTEGMWLHKETADEDLRAWGVYSYLQYQLGASWFLGVRGDLVQPVWDDDKLLWQVVPYATLWQSEFVYFRLEASHGQITATGHDTRIVLQINWAAGPHKHEKY